MKTMLEAKSEDGDDRTSTDIKRVTRRRKEGLDKTLE
jgi:hypothetical protein